MNCIQRLVLLLSVLVLLGLSLFKFIGIYDSLASFWTDIGITCIISTILAIAVSPRRRKQPKEGK